MIRVSTVCATLLLCGAAQAATVTLSGTIRDFNDTHPDMQRAVDGVQTGKVSATLDGDGKPVFTGAENVPGSSFSTAANFAQWYRDVPGVNQSKAFSLDLTLSGTNYTYTNNSFFPIDNQLLGNQGRSHNYHFTLELGGQLAWTDTAQTFNFTGDDDLWVYVGNKLVLDLGGVHSAASKSFTGADLQAAGLAAGTNHALKIFFAERHTTQSNFSIQTNFVVDPPAPVPVPAALPLMATGLAGLGWLARRRRTV
jgi:fibro-slime domain-containing protein